MALIGRVYSVRSSGSARYYSLRSAEDCIHGRGSEEDGQLQVIRMSVRVGVNSPVASDDKEDLFDTLPPTNKQSAKSAFTKPKASLLFDDDEEKNDRDLFSSMSTSQPKPKATAVPQKVDHVTKKVSLVKEDDIKHRVRTGSHTEVIAGCSQEVR